MKEIVVSPTLDLVKQTIYQKDKWYVYFYHHPRQIILFKMPKLLFLIFQDFYLQARALNQ
tara:strand:- start:2541 stop:2720 length:180 start_codon:yes stop_codon:yes gene_type:complete